MKVLQKNRIFIITVLLAFLSGAVIMSYEILTARLLSPLLGSSIYTWIAAIGMVLAGMTIGVWFGGWASKKNHLILLPVSYIVSGATIGGAFLLQPMLRDFISASSLSLPALALIVAGIFAFVQTLALSFAGPLFIELITLTLEDVGPKYSALSIAGSLGSIIGVFVGGFVLVPLVGIVASIVVLTLASFAMAILASSLLAQKKLRSNMMIATTILLFLALCAFVFIQPKKAHSSALLHAESPYYTIHAYDSPFRGAKDARWLFLDFDSHSIDTHGEKIGLYTDFAYALSEISPESKNILVLGAGAYTIPKILAKAFPEEIIDVIEIDPMLEEVGKEFFNTSDYRNIKTEAGDPRYLLPKTEKEYDIIFNDIYQSFISVPSHLVTTEFLSEIKEHLTPKGLYVMSFIATGEGPGHKVAQHMVATAEEAFVDVRVLFFGGEEQSINSFIIIASKNTIPYSQEELTAIIRSEAAESSSVHFTKVDTKNIRPFTDNWQPMDSLMRPLMNEYFPPYKNIYYDITNPKDK